MFIKKNIFIYLLLFIILNNFIFNKCIEGDCKNGFGTFKDKSGSIYVGNFKNKKFEGLGTYTWVDKTFYKGNFSKGLRDETDILR